VLPEAAHARRGPAKVRVADARGPTVRVSSAPRFDSASSVLRETATKQEQMGHFRGWTRAGVVAFLLSSDLGAQRRIFSACRANCGPVLAGYRVFAARDEVVRSHVDV